MTTPLWLRPPPPVVDTVIPSKTDCSGREEWWSGYHTPMDEVYIHIVCGYYDAACHLWKRVCLGGTEIVEVFLWKWRALWQAKGVQFVRDLYKNCVKF